MATSGMKLSWRSDFLTPAGPHAAETPHSPWLRRPVPAVVGTATNGILCRVDLGAHVFQIVRYSLVKRQHGRNRLARIDNASAPTDSTAAKSRGLPFAVTALSTPAGEGSPALFPIRKTRFRRF